MSDPKHWLNEESESTSVERELLRAGREVKLPPHLKRGIWLGISAQGISTAAAAGTAGVGASVAKGLVVLGLVGSTVFTGVWVARHRGASSPPPVAQLPNADPAGLLAAPAGAPPVPAEMPRGAAEGTKTNDDLPALPGAPAAHATPRATPRVQGVPAPSAEPSAETTPASRLREESQAIVESRSALRAGDPKGALRLLELLRARYPDGALVQEREALTIEALARSGQTEAASRRAQTFLRNFPGSAHAADVRTFLSK
jgi:hypothetical protein